MVKVPLCISNLPRGKRLENRRAKLRPGAKWGKPHTPSKFEARVHLEARNVAKGTDAFVAEVQGSGSRASSNPIIVALHTQAPNATITGF